MFGIEIIDAGLLPAMIVALMAGLVSFLSPCVLPIVPPYLAYMSGVSVSDLNRKERSAQRCCACAFLCVGVVHRVFAAWLCGLGAWQGFTLL